MRRDIIDLRLFTRSAFAVDITPRASLAFVTELSSIAERFDTIAEKFARCDRIISTGILTECFEKTRLHDTFINVNFTILSLKADSTFTAIFTWAELGADTFVLARIWVALINDFITICSVITVGTFTMIHCWH
jgi:hypothetical protein